ncbi:hypothetical protein QUF80_18135 [Desulfococcaceae bacterium HSG8]|nr:hypothetical protein [Desulfococcaceae bacterium HSG8]
MRMNTSLKEVLEKYYCLKGICENARKRASDNPTSPFVTAISLPVSDKKVKDKREHIIRYFNKIRDSVTDYCFLDMVAVFERIIFSKVDNASGEIRRVVKDGYSKPVFHMSAASFVKDKEEIYNLSGVKKLLEGKISQELSDNLSEIFEHRNFLAHGRRGIGKQSALTMDEVHDILQETLNVVTNRRVTRL